MFIASLKSDSVFVPIDKELPFDDVIYVASHSDCRVLFFSKKYKKYIADIMEKIPEIEYYIGLDEDEDDGRILSYKKLVELGRQNPDTELVGVFTRRAPETVKTLLKFIESNMEKGKLRQIKHRQRIYNQNSKKRAYRFNK